MSKKEHWQQELAQARAELNAVLDSLSPEQWQETVYSEGQTWTVQDIVSHLVDSESGMSIHIYKIRKGRETVPEGFDLNKWNAGVKERTGPATPAELRQRLAEVRHKTLEGLASLQDEEWQLTGRHPLRGIITVDEYFDTITSHERDHTRHIKQAVGQV